MDTLLTLTNVHGIYCDALATDEHQGLIFTSLWGRDTAIQELLARLTLPVSAGGLTTLTFSGPVRQIIQLENLAQWGKLSGRMPKSCILGDMVQLWLFDKRLQQADFANQQAYLLLDARQPPIDSQQQWPADAAWQLFKSICQLPMLDTWQDAVLSLLTAEQWLRFYRGFRVNVLAIELPGLTFEQRISQMIVAGVIGI